MTYNNNSGYGRGVFGTAKDMAATLGRTFVVSASTSANFKVLSGIFPPDPDGLVRLYATITAALAATSASRGDVILIDPLYTTAPTLAELATAHTNNVQMVYANVNPDGSQTAFRVAATLPQTTTGALFTVTAPVRILDIVGEVTTTVQTQTDNANLIIVPTVGSTQNLCATADITGLVTGSIAGITGTLATALQTTTTGVMLAPAAQVMVPAGSLRLSCSASNTGAMKWLVRYIPLAPGAAIIPA